MTYGGAIVRLSVCIVCACASPSQPKDGANSRTIAPLWQRSVGSPSTDLRLGAVTSAAVIVGGTDALFGLDLKTGAQKWKLSVPFQMPRSGIVSLVDSLAALVTSEGFVVFDPGSGRVLRQWYDVGAARNPSQTLPLLLSDGRVLIASRALELLALDVHTGRLDTLVRLPGDSSRHPYISSLTLYRDTIYAPVASDASRGAAFKNTVQYRYATSTRALDSLQPDVSDSASLTRWQVAFPDLLVSATDYSEPSWLGFDRGTGIRRWKVPASPASLGPGAQVGIVGDTMFAAGNDGKAYLIHIPTGRLIRTQAIRVGLATGVAVCGGDVLINIVGEIVALSRNGVDRKFVSGLPEGKDSFIGEFAVGNGIAVIGSGGGDWIALPCAAP